MDFSVDIFALSNRVGEGGLGKKRFSKFSLKHIIVYVYVAKSISVNIFAIKCVGDGVEKKSDFFLSFASNISFSVLWLNPFSPLVLLYR